MPSSTLQLRWDFLRLNSASAGLCRWLAACSLLLGLTLGTLQAQQAPEKPFSEDQVLVMGVNKNLYPWSFVDKDGEISGFAVDLSKAVARIMKLRVRQELMNPQHSFQQTWDSGADIIQAVAISPERAPIMDFSVPFLHLYGSIIVRKGSTGIRSVSDLKGKKVLVQSESLGEKFLKSHGLKDSIVYVDTVMDAVKRLSAGEGDAALGTRLTTLSIARHLELDNLEAVGAPLDDFVVSYAYAVRPGNRVVLAKLNEGLALLHDSGEFDQIYERWFSKVDPKGFSTLELALVGIAGLSVALAVAMIAGFRERRLSLRIQSSEALYRGIFESSPEGILVLERSVEDPEAWTVQQANPAAKGLFRQEGRPTVGRDVRTLLVENPQAAGQIHETLDSGAVQIFEIDRSTTHRLSWLRIAVAPAGQRRLVVVTDLSEAKSAQEKIRQGEEQIRQTQKLEAIGTLASGVAHDFNNILTVILGCTEMLKHGEPGAREHAELVNDIDQSAERARGLVRQILSFSRRSESRRGRMNLLPLIREVERFIRAASPASIEMRVNAPETLPDVEADTTQLHQVLVNLCTNAVHAMKGTAGRLELNAELVEINESNRALHTELRDGLYIRVSVRDNGHGMSAEVQRRIFEPFFTTKAAGEGTGLGLSVVHGILKQHGGGISVYSEPGRGTVFHTYLPALAGAAKAELDSAQGALARGSGERILLVDDEPLIVKALQSMLLKLGYRVTTFASPIEALAALRNDPAGFDLLLTDFTMPRLSGLELVREARTLRPALPALIMSGFLGELDQQQLQSLEGVLSLDKPVSLRSLSETLASLLNAPGG